ncbi:conserved hypothetical protein [Culex quinquefasciatus]|uniref:Uncharacterized protein n=1 Tax=Culex quinquefasciatus TaxID=7176 RepID=B0WW07_CULQU|nr:conserved hypothetical protein [Culex quinquefasciatus]|eukprot:XP_001861579.1 conserved hypothetical protein [Culex quinquefasciatus]
MSRLLAAFTVDGHPAATTSCGTENIRVGGEEGECLTKEWKERSHGDSAGCWRIRTKRTGESKVKLTFLDRCYAARRLNCSRWPERLKNSASGSMVSEEESTDKPTDYCHVPEPPTDVSIGGIVFREELVASLSLKLGNDSTEPVKNLPEPPTGVSIGRIAFVAQLPLRLGIDSTGPVYRVKFSPTGTAWQRCRPRRRIIVTFGWTLAAERNGRFDHQLPSSTRALCLLDVLRESTVQDDKFQLPEGSLNIKKGTATELSPIIGDLNPWGSFTQVRCLSCNPAVDSSHYGHCFRNLRTNGPNLSAWTSTTSTSCCSTCWKVTAVTFWCGTSPSWICHSPINLENPQPPIRREGSPESDYGNSASASSEASQKPLSSRNNNCTATAASGVPESDEKGAVESDKDDDGMLDTDVEVDLTEDWQSKKIVTQNSNQSSGGRKSLTMRRKIRAKRLNRIWCMSIEQQKAKAKERRKRTVSHADWGKTLVPRYQCEDELMVGNSKVCCDACIERINSRLYKCV